MKSENAIEWIILLILLLCGIHLLIVEEYAYGVEILTGILGYIIGRNRNEIVALGKKMKLHKK